MKKNNNKALVTVIIIGVAFVVIGAAILGVNMLRNSLSHAASQGSLAIEAAKNPVASEEMLPALHAVELRLGAVNVNVIPADRNELVTDGFDAGELTVTMDEKDGQLVVEQRNYNRFRITGNYKITRTLTLYLDVQELDDFDLVIGVGTLTFDALTAEDAKFEIGTGEVNFTDCTFASINMILGAGELDCSRCAFSDFTLSSGASSVTYGGTLAGRCELESGVGETVLRLSDSANNYNFNFTRGLGVIRINGNDSFGIGSHSIGRIGAPTFVTISSGVGSVTIDTDTDAA